MNNLPKHISFTQMSIYERCPRLYKVIYLDGVNEETKLMMIGKDIHKIIEAINLKIKNTKKDEIDVNDIRDIFNKYMGNNFTGIDEYNKIWKSILIYAEETFKSIKNIVEVEYEVRYKIKDGRRRVELVGIIDRMDLFQDELEIIDLKMMKIPTKDEVRNDFQLNVYAYLISKIYPEFKISTSIYSILHNIKVKVNKEPSDFDYIPEYVVNLYKKMHNDTVFEPILNDRCYECPRKCEKYINFLKNNLQIENINEDNLVRLYFEVSDKVKILSKVKDEIKNLLMDRVRNYGDFEKDGYYFTIEAKHRDAYMVEAVDYEQLVIKKIKNVIKK
ncbi:MAG: PD-(D/E)XK nuclease family protein [Thermoplasmata archaeon]